MKPVLIAALASLLMIGGASAADLGNNRSSDYSNDPIMPEVQGSRVNWSGFYFGGRLGYGNANHDLAFQRFNGAYCYDNKGDAETQPEDSTAPLPWRKDTQKSWQISNLLEDGTCEEPDQVVVDPSSKEFAGIDGVNSHGIFGGGQIGADKQMGRWVAGIFGSYDLNQMETEASNVIGIKGNGKRLDVESIEKGDEWSAGVRLGYLVTPSAMLYALAAYTETSYTFSGFDSGEADAGFSKETDFNGVSVGGGIEVAVTNNIFIGAEYQHTFYGEETVLDTGGSDVGGFGQRIVDDLDEDKIMGTLKIKLNSDLF